MSPSINSLPIEILGSIFESADRSIDRRRSDATAHSLLNALLVCHYWHTIITSTPSLWTTVWIGDRHSALISEPSAEDEIELPALINLRKSLERSGQTLPLDIIVHAEAPSNERVKVLKQYIDRWISITFLPGEVPDEGNVQSYFNLELPNLHTVDIQLEVAFQNDKLFITAPQLQTLKCISHRVYFLGAAPPLVHIDVKGDAYVDSDTEYPTGVGVPFPLESLEPCKETVEFLSFAANWGDEGEAPVDDKDIAITFPRLHTLRLNEWSIYASNFLHRASFPALRTLHVGWMVDPHNATDLPNPEDLTPFPNFPHLRELQWEGRSPEKLGPLRILLASAPNLQILSDQDVLGPEGEGGALISALLDVVPPGTQMLCPVLREVHIRRASSAEIDLLTADIGRSTLKIISVHNLTDWIWRRR